MGFGFGPGGYQVRFGSVGGSICPYATKFINGNAGWVYLRFLRISVILVLNMNHLCVFVSLQSEFYQNI